MKVLTKYQSVDGSEWNSAGEAVTRDALCEQIAAVMLPLGEVPKEVSDGKGWLQHDLETVLKAKDGIIEICREQGLGKAFESFNHPGRDIHPLSVVGRILDDCGGPLNKAWGRFARIDDRGREHQQPYFAYTNGPLPEHVCIESRI